MRFSKVTSGLIQIGNQSIEDLELAEMKFMKMTAQKKRWSFQIEAFVHQMVADLTYTEKIFAYDIIPNSEINN